MPLAANGCSSVSALYRLDTGFWLMYSTDELTKQERISRVAEPEFSQALTTAIQIGLVDLFEWLGVMPSVVLGHSSGEISAAYVYISAAHIA